MEVGDVTPEQKHHQHVQRAVTELELSHVLGTRFWLTIPSKHSESHCLLLRYRSFHWKLELHSQTYKCCSSCKTPHVKISKQIDFALCLGASAASYMRLLTAWPLLGADTVASPSINKRTIEEHENRRGQREASLLYC